MASKANNSGCGLMAICLLIIVAISKCGGIEQPSTVALPAASPDAAASIPVDAATMYVATATLNCRAEPQKDARAVEKLTRGDTVEAGATRGTWVSLDRPGEDCWVAQRFLSDSAPEPEAAPVATYSRPARLYSPSTDSMPALSPRQSSGGGSCGSKRTCGQMNSCDEAYHYLNSCGLSRLDRDGDGVPCESIC